jgi:hypothetical protein
MMYWGLNSNSGPTKYATALVVRNFIPRGGIGTEIRTRACRATALVVRNFIRRGGTGAEIPTRGLQSKQRPKQQRQFAILILLSTWYN